MLYDKYSPLCLLLLWSPLDSTESFPICLFPSSIILFFGISTLVRYTQQRHLSIILRSSLIIFLKDWNDYTLPPLSWKTNFLASPPLPLSIFSSSSPEILQISTFFPYTFSPLFLFSDLHILSAPPSFFSCNCNLSSFSFFFPPFLITFSIC